MSFVWFGDRYDVCQFPNMRYFVVVDCSVVNVREVLNVSFRRLHQRQSTIYSTFLSKITKF